MFLHSLSLSLFPFAASKICSVFNSHNIYLRTGVRKASQMKIAKESGRRGVSGRTTKTSPVRKRSAMEKWYQAISSSYFDCVSINNVCITHRHYINSHNSLFLAVGYFFHFVLFLVNQKHKNRWNKTHGMLLA